MLESSRVGIHPRVTRPTRPYENIGTGRGSGGSAGAKGGSGEVKAGNSGSRGERF